MRVRAVQWVNTPVLMEALVRYEQGLLPKSMRLWVEEILELNPKENSPSCLKNSQCPHGRSISIIDIHDH